MFSKKTAKNGRVMYFKESRLISKEQIPDGVAVLDRDFDMDVERIDEPTGQNANVKAEAETPAPVERNCVFCGEPGTSQRFINLTTVHLCQEHYLNRSVGEIAERLRQS